MQGLILLGAVVGLANAWTYPDCEPDNCYRNLIDSRFTATIGAFCTNYIAPSATATAVPADYNNCGSPAELSSACSCIAYTYTHSASASASPSPSTSSTPATTTSAPYYPTTTSTTSPVYPTSTTLGYTTSTVYVTTVKTITSCAKTVTNCPATEATHTYLVTDTISSYTTVCPVTATETPVYPVSKPVTYTSTYYTTEVITVSSCAAAVTNCPYTTKTTVYPVTTVCTTTPAAYTAPSVGTITYSTKSVGTVTPYKTTSSALQQVTNAAGRVGAGFEMVAAAAGLVAAAFL